MEDDVSEDVLTTPSPTVSELLLRSYRRHAGRPAVEDGSRGLTYGELYDEARAVAAGLAAAGAAQGDRVMLIGLNSVDWIVVDHACHLGGFVRVAPLTRLHLKELAQIAADSDPVVLLADRDWLERSGTDFLPSTVKKIVTINGEALPGTTPFAELQATPPLAGEAVAPQQREDAEWLLFTSGSTGLPKGVQLSDRAIGAMTRNILEAVPQLGPDDVMLHTAPLSHFSGALGLGTFAAGGLNLLHPTFELDDVVATLNTGRVSVLALVPTQIAMLTDHLLQRASAGSPVDTSSLQGIVYAGSAIAPDRLARAQQLFGPIMIQFYGASESPMPMTRLRAEDHVETVGSSGLPRLASAGQPSRFVELRVVGPEGEPLPSGTSGEIQCRGEQVMTGYWRNPEATAEVLTADGWLSTGDVGLIDDAGYLFIVDRRKDMIVSGGFNVFPREVENVISTLPEVREVAVVGAPSDKWGEQITAVVSLQPGASLDQEKVIAHCREAIAGYKVPKSVLFVDDLPKSGVGKIQKNAIRDEMWAGRSRRV
jgi:long-chain acyl-CoA synthetase